MKKSYLSLFLFLLLISSAYAIQRIDLPNYTGFVNDFAGVIEPPYKEKLEGLCSELEKKTTAELAIATVKTVSPLDSKMYAVKLFEKWKIGKKGKDNGVLMLLAMDERRVEIEVGYGLEGVITDGTAGEILDKYVVPRLKEGKFGEGLYYGAEAIASRISEASGVKLGEEYQGFKRWDRLIMPIIIIAIILLIFLSIFASGLASGLVGAIIGGAFGYFIAGIIGAIIGALIGFVLSYTRLPGTGTFPGFHGGFGGGGFTGFGGGRSGGGGAGRGW